jgi:hypothetical protein
VSLAAFCFFILAIITSPIWISLLIINIPLIGLIVVLMMYTNLFNPLIKLYWRFVMGSFTLWYRGDDLTLLNTGYAELNKPTGIFLEGNSKALFDKYRIQLYHKVVVENGEIDSMEGKTLLETGCGRGGGLNYLAEVLKPQYAIGLDMTAT